MAISAGVFVRRGELEAHPEPQPFVLAQAPPRSVPPPAGSREAVTTVARLSVTILDAQTGSPTPARVRITDEAGKPLGPSGLGLRPTMGGGITARLSAPGSVIGLPKEAIAVMYGTFDAAEGYGFQPNGAFYVDGAFDLPMPKGTFSLTITKGFEFVEQTEKLVFKEGDHLTRSYPLLRWIDMPARGWHSADDHIHLRRSPRENPLILGWIAAEDIHVGVLLQVGDFLTTHFSQYGWGPRGNYAHGGHLLTSGQEDPRTEEFGHTLSLGANQFVRYPDEYYEYDRVFDKVRAVGGVSGYAHQAVSFHGYRGLALDALRGKVDFLEVMQFCVREGPLAVEHYYRFLDLGCKLTALAGSDFPWCGRGSRPGEEQVGPQIGNARFYTYTGGALSYDRWLTGIKSGNTFATTGPMLELEVNGQRPGSSIDVKPGTKLRIVARAHGHANQIPLQRLQIVGHGKVLHEALAGEAGQNSAAISLDAEIVARHGLWLAARADAGPAQMAHSTPVYITVNGDGFHTRENLASQIERAKAHLMELRAQLVPPAAQEKRPPRSSPPPWRYPDSVARIEQKIIEAEKKLEELRSRP